MVYSKFLQKICDKSDLKGLVYHGGPKVVCECCEWSGILHCVDYPDGDDIDYNPMCDKCNTQYNTDELLNPAAKSKVHVFDEKPTTRDLTLIRWNDGTEKRRLRIIDEVCLEWEKIGTILDIPSNKLEQFRMETSHNSQKCCKNLFEFWLKNPPEQYPPTWDAFIELLKDIPFEELAKELKKALVNRA